MKYVRLWEDCLIPIKYLMIDNKYATYVNIINYINYYSYCK